LAAFLTLYNAVDLIVASSLRVRHITGLALDEQLVPFLRVAFKIVIIALAVVVLLQEWEYDVSGLIAGLGLGGLAFSLAAQDTVSNLFAFTTIVSDRPFVVGEFIVTPQVEGIVEQVGVRNVRIRRLDQAFVTIPNSKLTDGPVTNWSRLQKRWVNFTLGVTYSTTSSDMRVLLHRIREMLLTVEKVDSNSIVVLFTDFGDSALNILVRCYIYEPDWVKFNEIKQDINLQIMDIVADLGLSIAFPSRSLYIENLSMLDDGQGVRMQPELRENKPEALPKEESNRALYPGASAGDADDGDGDDR
ncbi:MAG: mechanosensitive ion channel family protein, partial [Anaerolineae bacterium]|nr:mechanosensitive ion channel family protein [Anaerolineae bacterium]